ncbi:hypothetical protein HX794_09085 [Pseudomonas costantinii]|uniref:hypothetical protein n=1 Tax=Pseudomonas costantinii TaxID=168469 RepID=UPI0015A3D29D|nr:hypothetical protein [Pseudomonas costantinii]NVZ19784.1 hypothetical protein [Pseudomonas costantinii]
MSRVGDTKRAYDKLARLLDEEIRNRASDSSNLNKIRETLDVAFYLLGWGQFEYLVRQESKEIVEENARAKTIDRFAWQHLRDALKDYPVRKRLDLIFNANHKVREKLDKDYTVRNEAAHNYKALPSEVKSVSDWLGGLEELIDKFEH